MRPFSDTPVTWTEMLPRNTSISRECYLELCRILRRKPSESEMNGLIADGQDDFISAVSDFLDISRSEFEQAAAAGWLLFRNDAPAGIAVQMDRGEWQRLPFVPFSELRGAVKRQLAAA